MKDRRCQVFLRRRSLSGLTEQGPNFILIGKDGVELFSRQRNLTARDPSKSTHSRSKQTQQYHHV